MPGIFLHMCMWLNFQEEAAAAAAPPQELYVCRERRKFSDV